ncbi:dihydrofolate reductase [Candidatus Saccharibacteria bacterium]|nr:dihydrofolate reductase [Candidatus Saccharibacteria bacterium]
MVIDAITAMSINGLITNGEGSDVRKWTSEEDKISYWNIRSQYNLLIVGGNTFKTMLNTFKHRDDVTVIVLTNHPEEFQGWENKVEFSSSKPQELVDSLEKRGFNKALVIGGSYVYNSFLNSELINDFYLTIEPVVFPSGTPLFLTDIQQNFKLISIEKLNDNGTLQLTYRKVLL